jgi:hypothetical protein
MIGRMRSSWLKRASLAIALFAAGAVVGDLAVRGSKSEPVPQVASAPVQVIHKRQVRTVRVHPRASSAQTSGVAPATSVVPASTPTATPVSSSASPGAAGGGGGGEGGEAERDD